MTKKTKSGKPRKKPDLSEYQIFKDGKFNLKKPPKGFNYHYGKCIRDSKECNSYDPTMSVGRLPDVDE